MTSAEVLTYTKTERSTRDRNHLLKHAFYVADFEDGDVILEFGVRSGTSLVWMANEIVRQDLQVKLYGFDSFELGGIPEETEGVWCHPNHFPGAMSVNKSVVEKQLPDDDRIILVQGWFEDTLSSELFDEVAASVKLVNIDCDQHSSTVTILDWLKPVMQVERSPGLLIHFDDWHEQLGRAAWGEKLAWMDFSQKNPDVHWECLVSCDHGRRIIEVQKEDFA